MPASRPRSRGVTRRSIASSRPCATGRRHAATTPPRTRLHRRGPLRLAARPPRPRPPEGRGPRRRVRRPGRPTAPTAWPANTPTRSSSWRSSARSAARSPSSSGRSPTTRTTSSCSRSRGPSPSTSGPLLGERFRRGKLQKARAGRGSPAGLLRLPIRAGERRGAGAPDDRRGGGRAGAAPVPVADRRADDRPPDPQEAGRRPVAAALRPEAVVNRGRASHPRRPGLRRHGLREPAREHAPRTAVPLRRPGSGG